MSAVFDNMQSVRTAFDALQSNQGNASARAAFIAAHGKHRDAYVESFEVAGATYPRTDGHRLNETQARQAIDQALLAGAMPEELKPGVVAIAYPLPAEVLRHEIEATIRAAKLIVGVNWKTDTINAADALKVRELLRMPTEAGSYAALRERARTGKLGDFNPYRGFQADHVIADKALRGVGTGRRDSLTEAFGLATMLQDGQNKGSQHKYATDGQNLVYAEFKAMGRNPTVGEYLERAFIWMTSIYTRADLVVDGAMKNNLMSLSGDFRDYQVKGHAVAQAGYMTWPERETVGRAISTALMITLREHFTAHGWDLLRELPLIQDAPHRHVTGDQTIPSVTRA